MGTVGWLQRVISEDEQRAIVDGLNDPPLREIRVGGRQYRCTMSSLDLILSSKLSTAETESLTRGVSGCIIKKTNQAVIVAEYPSKSSEMDVLAGVEQLGNYFVTKGY
ncbi:hypothetical protein PISMIDRAFT_690072 [Pisolithus microcarpus 441]|uniref:Profilin n=1 Tax=Pisolithus microcarpus 441 TaxID=765257 RepID=A0A0C9YN88_9AGAM|nr:hypothetical protein PISMIDRAFT_690072 [Pisolithus microcarpus 441]